eukprot:CAMPEP_0115322214 /NCGR_PEP_ID=MMETSP0270-20121206/81281_1 /TAXON_ID=71861 /ORGANISM="Scrippsiella trochoidea, Strain CCMP3099" /LENGTH=53 /DNA_ID=CAMNT_0002742161 /DNA_START=6 /DNA_END=168 /DNA_ORIENTATION=+
MSRHKPISGNWANVVCQPPRTQLSFRAASAAAARLKAHKNEPGSASARNHMQF